MTASSPPSVEAARREGSFEGARGTRIHWQSWAPPAVKAVVVIAHGASEHGGRYGYVVDRLVPDGFAVYAIDHRGHGRSDGRRVQLDRMDHVVSDLDRLVMLAAGEHGGVPVFLLGHSMGGCISIAYALSHQDRLAGLALSAPLAALAAAAPPLRVIARMLSSVAPNLGLYKVESNAVSRDPAEVEAYETDPLVYRGKLPARTLQELADTIGRFHDEVPRITIPLLVMIPTADTLVPPAGGRMVFERAGSADKTLESYEGFFHELFNEPVGERDRPLNDLAAWLSARLG